MPASPDPETSTTVPEIVYLCPTAVVAKASAAASVMIETNVQRLVTHARKVGWRIKIDHDVHERRFTRLDREDTLVVLVEPDWSP